MILAWYIPSLYTNPIYSKLISSLGQSCCSLSLAHKKIYSKCDQIRPTILTLAQFKKGLAKIVKFYSIFGKSLSKFSLLELTKSGHTSYLVNTDNLFHLMLVLLLSHINNVVVGGWCQSFDSYNSHKRRKRKRRKKVSFVLCNNFTSDSIKHQQHPIRISFWNNKQSILFIVTFLDFSLTAPILP